MNNGSVKANERFKINDSVFMKEFAGKILAIDPVNAKWVKTNETGQRILELMDGSLTVGEIQRDISKKYNVPEKLIQEDVEVFIDKCIQKGMVRLGMPNATSSESGAISSQGKLNTVYINITSKFDPDYPNCHNGGSMGVSNDLDSATWINVLKEIDQMDIEELIIKGGEPLIRKDMFEIIKESGLKNTKSIGLITSGTNIKDTNIEEICSCFNAVQIALDGVSKETHETSRGEGTFDRAISAIELLKSSLGRSRLDQINISMTVHAGNKHEIRKMVRFAYSKNCNLFFNNVLPLGRADDCGKMTRLDTDQYVQVVNDAYDEFIKIINENNLKGMKTRYYIKPSNIKYASIYLDKPMYNCGLGGKKLSIGSTGEVYPCRGLEASGMSAGNIQESSLKSIYEKLVKRYSLIIVDKIAECNSCTLRYFCGGGCRIFGFDGGGLLGKDPNCRLYKASIYSAMLCKDKNINELMSTMKDLCKNESL